MKALKNLSYEKVEKDVGLLSLEERRLREDLIGVYKYLKEGATTELWTAATAWCELYNEHLLERASAICSSVFAPMIFFLTTSSSPVTNILRMSEADAEHLHLPWERVSLPWLFTGSCNIWTRRVESWELLSHFFSQISACLQS